MAQASGGSLDRSMARAVAWNAAARWGSQVISWSSTILVARLLTPYDYGVMGMAGLYLNLAMLISQTGIGDAVIALRDLNSRQIAELNTVSLFIGAALAALSCAVAFPFAHFFSSPPLAAIVIIASITYLISAFPVVPRALLQRELRFKLLASIETARALFQTLAIVLFAWLKFRYWSLLIGYIIGCATTAILTCYFKRHEFAFPRFTQLRRELKFTRHVMLSGIAWYSYDNSDFGVAGRVLGSNALGNYSVAWTISSAPIEKIGNLVTGVTPAFFSAIQTDKAELRRYVLRLTEILSFATVPASIGLALAADYLVPVLLGPKWMGVIGPLRWLGLLVAARSVGTILPKLLTSIGDARFVMWVTVGAAILMPIAFLGGSHWGPEGIAAAWVIGYPVIAAPLYYRVFQKTGMRLREYVSAISPALTASLIMAVVVLLIRFALPKTASHVVTLSLIVISGGLSYIAALFALHRQRVTQVLRSARSMFRPQGGSQVA